MAASFNTILRNRTYDDEGHLELTFTVEGYTSKAIAQALVKGEKYRISLTAYGNKRTLEQNAYMWALIHEVALAMGQTDMEVYINALEIAEAKYEYIACLPEAEGLLKQQFRAIKLMNQFEHNGRTFNQYKAFYGTSKMNTKEMTTMIDTVNQMAVELDIPIDEERFR